MYRVVYSLERPVKELVNELRSIPTATLSDGMKKYNTMDHEMKPIWRGARVCGPAITVQTYTADNIMCHKAVEVAQPGDILVINGGGYKDASPWGELISLSCKVKGIEGVVLDGAARDVEKIEEMGFPVFARAVVPRGTVKATTGWINEPIQCGGVLVDPGDIVVGDSDGVVVVPKEDAKAILEEAKGQLKQEEEWRRQVLKGKLLLHILGFDEKLKKDIVEIG